MAKKVMPLERSLGYFREQGIPCSRVERWQMAPNHPAGGVRVDAFGFIDALAIFPQQVVAVQCCGGNGVSDHIKKIVGIPESVAWLKTGAGLHIHSWKKRAKPIGRSHWQLRWLVASLNDGQIAFEDMPLTV